MQLYEVTGGYYLGTNSSFSGTFMVDFSTVMAIGKTEGGCKLVLQGGCIISVKSHSYNELLAMWIPPETPIEDDNDRIPVYLRERARAARERKV